MGYDHTPSITSGSFQHGGESIETLDLFGTNDVMEVDSNDAYNQDNYETGYGQNFGSNSMRQTMHGNIRKGRQSHSNTYEPEVSYSPVKIQNTVSIRGVSKMDYSNGNAHVSLRQSASQPKPQIQYVDEVHLNHARADHDEGNSYVGNHMY